MNSFDGTLILFEALALIVLAFIAVAQCNRKYPAPVPGFPQDAARHPLVIRRQSNRAFLYSNDFELLARFAGHVGVHAPFVNIEPQTQVYSLYLNSEQSFRVQQLYGV